METFMDLEAKDLAKIVVMNGVGAEKFAEHAFTFADDLIKEKSNGRCWCVEAEVAEHGANSAIYRG
jgi:6-pyruvoyltetrahydropterin/6-carboxytetrahydropterin synthase